MKNSKCLPSNLIRVDNLRQGKPISSHVDNYQFSLPLWCCLYDIRNQSRNKTPEPQSWNSYHIRNPSSRTACTRARAASDISCQRVRMPIKHDSRGNKTNPSSMAGGWV